MAKAKISRKSTFIDMAPMVDLAFLLITFFMLTIKFKPPSNLEIATPGSISEVPVKDKDVLKIEIDKKGRIFVGTNSINDRIATIGVINDNKKLNLSDDEIRKLALLETFGMPYAKLKSFANLDPSKRDEYLKNSDEATIPSDSTDNQLQAWLLNYRLQNNKLMPTIRADKDVPYPVVRNVIETLKKQKANRFKIITDRKAPPA
jgi:biopolymer transport protein ExbD